MSAVSTLVASPPGRARRVGVVVEANLRAWRSGWYGAAISLVATPALYLVALGFGLGRLLPAGTAFDGVAYATYLAPGILAATAFQTGASESTWAFLAKIRWRRTFHSVVATPVAVSELVAGHFLTVALRVGVGSAAFALVAAALGTMTVGRGLLATGPAVLVGLAVTAPVAAFAAHIDQDEKLATLFRFGIVPAVLLSGTFFPLSQLPTAVAVLAAATPLWHGVELTRAVVIGIPPAWPAWAHTLVLLAWFAVCAPLAARKLARRLLR